MRYIFILLIVAFALLIFAGCNKALIQPPGKYGIMPSFTFDEMMKAEGFISTKPDGVCYQYGDTLYLEYSTLDSLPVNDSTGQRSVDSVAKRGYSTIFPGIQYWQRWSRSVCFIIDYIGNLPGEKRYVYPLSNKMFDRL